MKKINILFFFLSTLLASCVQETPNLETANKDICTDMIEKVRQFYVLKYNCAVNFENREQITIPNIFLSEETKEAALFKLFMLGIPGLENCHQSVDIPENFVQNINDSTWVVVGVESMSGMILHSEDKQIVNTGGQHFFFFVRRDGEWLIDDIRIIYPTVPYGTPYRPDITLPFITKESAIIKAASTDAKIALNYEQRKIFSDFFQKKIDKITFDDRMKKWNEKLQNQFPIQLPTRPQSNINGISAALYALTYTSECDPPGAQPAFYNKNYTYFSSDCTNFISQCLYAGGYSFKNFNINPHGVNSWWYNNKNTKPTSDDSYSHSWVNANGLYNHLSNNVNIFSPAYAHSTVLGMNLGGLFFIDFEANNDIDHIVIVTKVVDIGNYRQLLISSHTNDHRNYNVAVYEEILDFSGGIGQYCILL